MNERITLISILKESEVSKIQELTKVLEKPLCKVPFGKSVIDRLSADTLPTHFTLFVWSIVEEEEVKGFLDQIIFPKLQLFINKIMVKDGKEDSKVLYFSVVPTKELLDLEKQIYAKFPIEAYHPDTFNFHITIHIDKNEEKIMHMKRELEQSFKPFILEINQFGLYEIYPAKLVKLINGRE